MASTSGEKITYTAKPPSIGIQLNELQSVKKVIIKPDVLPSVSIGQKFERCVGVLLGNIKVEKKILGCVVVEKTLVIVHSFSVPLNEDKEKNTWFLDMEYLEAMNDEFFKDSVDKKIVGWYRTGPKLCENDISIDEQVKRFTASPVLILTQAISKNLGLPTEVYYNAQDQMVQLKCKVVEEKPLLSKRLQRLFNNRWLNLYILFCALFIIVCLCLIINKFWEKWISG